MLTITIAHDDIIRSGVGVCESLRVVSERERERERMIDRQMDG